ncbi:hypothetical protein F4778DRAFT_786881 [Xylariomycetidae sp. FL2044]|nr:hypothetical protein F4778DRAFT_786881 [Xylariomycetidae sp. FL2044]
MTARDIGVNVILSTLWLFADWIPMTPFSTGYLPYALVLLFSLGFRTGLKFSTISAAIPALLPYASNRYSRQLSLENQRDVTRRRDEVEALPKYGSEADVSRAKSTAREYFTEVAKLMFASGKPSTEFIFDGHAEEHSEKALVWLLSYVVQDRVRHERDVVLQGLGAAVVKLCVLDWENAGYFEQEFLHLWAVDRDAYLDLYEYNDQLARQIALLEE